MLYQDLLCKFFAAANYLVCNHVLEVYIRVDYNDDPRYRQKGLGTQLGVALLEYWLENGHEPQRSPMTSWCAWR
jgi:hypothetical protein